MVTEETVLTNMDKHNNSTGIDLSGGCESGWMEASGLWCSVAGAAVTAVLWVADGAGS